MSKFINYEKKLLEEISRLKAENENLKDFINYLNDVVIDGSYEDAYIEFLGDKDQ